MCDGATQSTGKSETSIEVNTLGLFLGNGLSQ